MTADSRSPRFSIVTAVYNVARYLDDFIESVERQGRTDLEVIAVDDGSTDDSLARLKSWQSRRPDLVTVLTKTNGGQASARNLGLTAAHGVWVTFTDPDDMLDRGHLDAIDSFIAAHPDVAMVGAARLLLDDTTGELRDTHPLRRHFAGGDRLIVLAEHPSHFYGSAPCAFFRRDLLDSFVLRFPDLRPNFEDAYLCCQYLLRLREPAVGFVGSARYIYRKRSDATSTMQKSGVDPRRYTTVLRDGYLKILDEAQRLRGSAPGWLQSQIIYELSYYLSTQDHIAGSPGAPDEVVDDFHALMRQICERLDPSITASFAARRLKPVWRDVLLHAYRDEPWSSAYVLVDRVDQRQKLLRASYRYSGPPPAERLIVGDQEIRPAFEKTRAINYHGRDLLYERILWLPTADPVTVELNGSPVEVVTKEPPAPVFEIDARSITGSLRRRTGRAEQARDKGLNRADRWLVKLAGSAVVRRRFRNAWVLMDRIHDADDSAEILFRYLRAKRKKINAWFVVERDTPDWRRLRADGYRRVVAHGSVLWKLLMLNAKHLISSHADSAVIQPPEIVRLGEPRWRFTFLQHGVIKDDLSNWLNPKPIDVFVVSTPQELESIAGDGNTYTYSHREVRLTGLPRFDKIRRIGLQFPDDKRDLILMTPTWRHWLLPPLAKGSQRRTLGDEFFSSDFLTQWLELLRSPLVASAAASNKLSIAFLPHPNLQSALPSVDLPDHVTALSYDSQSVQELFARAAILVTDYSSIAFNAAYIERPVVYFQFDADRVLGGGHVGKRGYFSYESDGFGPVCSTVPETEKAIADILAAGRSPSDLYRRRIDETFPNRDGRCSKRVTDAIIQSARPWTPATAPTLDS